MRGGGSLQGGRRRVFGGHPQGGAPL